MGSNLGWKPKENFTNLDRLLERYVTRQTNSYETIRIDAWLEDLRKKNVTLEYLTDEEEEIIFKSLTLPSPN